MALTLRTAITANDTTFDVLGSDDLEAGDFKTIDSETVVIRSVRSATLAYSEAARYRVSVYRGAGGTRAAAHAANASLATYSAGGLPATVTIQEALIAFDASGIESGNGHQVDITIPAGSYFRVEAIITEIWDQPGGLYIRVGDAAGAHLLQFAQYDPTNDTVTPTTYVARAGLPANGEVAAAVGANIATTGYALQESVVFVKFSEDDELATAGSARIVAIIFTPVS